MALSRRKAGSETTGTTRVNRAAASDAPCRLWVYLAQSAPVGVVLRRGPSDWFRLSVWHTDTDTIEHGQWVRGRVYERRSDLSPDGRLFVCFAGKPGGGRSWSASAGEAAADTWIAVSRPPWFTALALWLVGGTYCTGGFFLDDRTLYTGWTAPPNQGQLPSWLKREAVLPHLDPGFNWTDRTVHHNRLLRLGWRPVHHTDGSTGLLSVEPETWERAHPIEAMMLIRSDMEYDPHVYGGPHLVEFAVRVAADLTPGPRLASPPDSLRSRVAGARLSPEGKGSVASQDESSNDGTVIPLPNATWADWDQRGRLVVARGGRLYCWELDQGASEGRLSEVADFNDQVPDPQPAPARARTWPSAPRVR